MKFDKGLYVGKGIKHPNMVKWKLRCNAGQFRVYVIALAEGRDQLEIYHSAFLQQKYYRKHPPHIIGLAASYKEAVGIVIEIVEEALQKQGSLDLKQYLRSKYG
ncbi:MAG: hypothetical protein IKM28_06080 [Lachnospiraceae bacterium]|nr:hypothetical protein [Lachnospiraceae bacterium]